MVEINSATRLFTISDLVLLMQTDTTVGFSSQDTNRLYEIKSRQGSKPFLRVYKNFKALRNANIRIPNEKKSKVRRARKTTFIVKNSAFRVANTNENSSYLRDMYWYNSTSANKSGKNFQREFCEEKADIIVEDKNGLYEGQASSLYKINNKKMKRLR